jgi:hypothetical protein
MVSVRAVYVLRSLHLDVIARSRRLKQGEPPVRNVRQIKRHKFGFRPDGVFDALDNAPEERRDGCVASCVHGYVVRVFIMRLFRGKPVVSPKLAGRFAERLLYLCAFCPTPEARNHTIRTALESVPNPN